jgi:hypothetical protein
MDVITQRNISTILEEPNSWAEEFLQFGCCKIEHREDLQGCGKLFITEQMAVVHLIRLMWLFGSVLRS